MHRFLLLAIVASVAPGTAKAGLILYDFSGIVSAGATVTHDDIAIGESWKARFVIDDAVADSNADPTAGAYLNSVLSATVTFSGGFTKDLNFDPIPDQFGVDVADNQFASFDGVGAYLADGDAWLNASVIQSADLTTLTSDNLPSTGVSFTGISQPLSGFATGTFDFVDDNGQSISLVSFSDGEISFAASVPEPNSFGMLSLLALGLNWRRSRSTTANM